MSIRKTNVVDWLGIERGTGDVILTIADGEDWTNEQEHLSLLQQKLNTYLAFIESGEVFDRVVAEIGRPVARTVPIKVAILAKHPLPARAVEFLTYAVEAFKGAGFGLSHKVLSLS